MNTPAAQFLESEGGLTGTLCHPMPTLLIVEDHKILLSSLKSGLEEEGYRVLTASSGLEALVVVRREPLDAIILDLHMPKLDGFEAIRLMRADPRLANVPVMALTASAMMGDKEIALSAGFSSYLAKPIPLATLRQEVQRLLQSAE